MNLPIESFIPSGSGLLVQIILLVGAWFKFQNKVERLEEDKGKDEKKLDAAFKRIDENREECRRIYDEHQKDAAANREKINQEIAKLDAANMVTTEQLKNILSVLTEIKHEIAEFRKEK